MLVTESASRIIHNKVEEKFKEEMDKINVECDTAWKKRSELKRQQDNFEDEIILDIEDALEGSSIKAILAEHGLV